MPYLVEHLVENQGSLITVLKSDKVTSALEIMAEHDYSQLPVVDVEKHIVGMVTYESIMRATSSFNTQLEKLLVRDAIVNAPTHYLDDDLFDLLDELKDTNAVFIIDPSETPVGIVTSFDASEFFRNRTEDLMHVEDIEFTLKELIKKTYTDPKGELETEKLQSAVSKLFEQRTESFGSKKQKTFEDLTLGDYINLLMSKDVWNFCAPILDFEKKPLYDLLEKIRHTRNDLAHFRNEISASNRRELKYFASWLGGRYQDYEKQQKSILIDKLFTPSNKIETGLAVQEEKVNYRSTVIEEYKPIKEYTSIKKKNLSPSRYAALANWLAQQKEEKVSLTFEQVEQIINSRLPDSALQLRAWWANDRVGHYHSILWLEAGWKVMYVNLDEKQVIFSRL